MSMHFGGAKILTKFDVAERQLAQAIQLFFEGGDPISIHTLAEAAAQVLHDIKAQFGAKSILRGNERIRPERKREWLAALNKSRNFFKHADKDAGDTHEFIEGFNHFSLMDAVNMYLTAKGAWTPEAIVFFHWFSITYPEVLVDDAPFAAVLGDYRQIAPPDDASRRALAAKAIRTFRNGERVPKGVVLYRGLRGDA